MNKNTYEVLRMAVKMRLSANDLIHEAELIEEYGEYFHMSFMGYSEEHLREAAKLMYLAKNGGFIPAEDEEVQIIAQYTKGNYGDMIPGTVVLDYALSSYWRVMSIDRKGVKLQNVKGEKNGATMTVKDSTTHNTFVLLARKEAA